LFNKRLINFIKIIIILLLLSALLLLLYNTKALNYVNASLNFKLLLLIYENVFHFHTKKVIFKHIILITNPLPSNKAKDNIKCVTGVFFLQLNYN